jgi:hypothetical protein
VGKNTPPIEIRWIFYGDPEAPIRMNPGDTVTFSDLGGELFRIERDGNTLRITPLRLMVDCPADTAERHAAHMREHG